MVQSIQLSIRDSESWGNSLVASCQQWEDAVRQYVADADSVRHKVCSDIVRVKEAALVRVKAAADLGNAVLLAEVRHAMVAMEDLQQQLLASEASLHASLDKTSKNLAENVVAVCYSQGWNNNAISSGASTSLSRFMTAADDVIAERKRWVAGKCRLRHAKVIEFVDQQERELEDKLDQAGL